MYPPVPPEALALFVPSHIPLHEAEVDVAVTDRKGGSVIGALAVDAQPLASVTVTV
jgi:hypothetical protein